MTILGNIILGIAAFLYLVPLQLFLRQPIPTGHAAGGVIAFLFVTIPFWVTIFSVWCILLARGGFDWLGGGRGWQFLLILASFLAFAAVTSLVAMLRGDSQIPWALRPLIPWAIHVLPLAALVATLSLLNPGIEVPASFSRWTLSLCSALVLASSAGMIVQWIVWKQTRAVEAAKQEVAFYDENLRSLVAEVEALDPIKDLGRLLGHAAANRFEAPRTLAAKKIQTHPDLQAELTAKLTNEWKLEALGYLELNTPPDPAALAIPVRTALEGMARWIKGEVERSAHHWPEAFYGDTQMALAVADKYAPYGVDYLPAICAWRDAFDHPNARTANIHAPQLVDEWLAKHATAGNAQSVTSRK